MSTYDTPDPIKPQPWQVDALCAHAVARAAHVDGDGAAHVAQEEVMPHV